MSSNESRSPTFDGGEAAEQSGSTVVDVSGIPRDRPDDDSSEQPVEQPDKPNEAAQVVP